MGQSCGNVRGTVDNVKGTVDNINKAMISVKTCADNVSNAASAIKAAMPSVKIMAQHAKYMPAFGNFVSIAGVVAQGVQVYYTGQGVTELRGMREELVAQTGLDAPKKFAKQVYRYIRMKAEQAQDSETHVFFLYHPDTDWHPDFFEMVERDPLPDNFYGMSENLDALCVWMQYLRMIFTKNGKWGRTAVFDLLMPGYRPFTIKEPLAFAEKLWPLRLHGMIHNTKPHVQLNLPTADKDMLDLDGIGKWEKPRNMWDQVFHKEDRRLRVLGEIDNVDDVFTVAVGTRQVRRKRRKGRSHHGR
ncbi:uncharacterized protein PAC_10102 [Phialocephala subalpina]|uniref:Uncharacterized protein n=1 Tax=Phialocephala subalpina TaxID=576137 RepID=A0A1L7X5B0_9HELO|nr:uncharacterized protein PAC_10102 [Phialocephala subalpina]